MTKTKCQKVSEYRISETDHRIEIIDDFTSIDFNGDYATIRHGKYYGHSFAVDLTTNIKFIKNVIRMYLYKIVEYMTEEVIRKCTKSIILHKKKFKL